MDRMTKDMRTSINEKPFDFIESFKAGPPKKWI